MVVGVNKGLRKKNDKATDSVWGDMFAALGEGWEGFGPKWPAWLTPKVSNIVPGSPIALEGIPPTDGFLAGIVCLSPALVHALRGAVVTHVVGDMEDEGLNLYSDYIL